MLDGNPDLQAKTYAQYLADAKAKGGDVADFPTDIAKLTTVQRDALFDKVNGQLMDAKERATNDIAKVNAESTRIRSNADMLTAQAKMLETKNSGGSGGFATNNGQSYTEIGQVPVALRSVVAGLADNTIKPEDVSVRPSKGQPSRAEYLSIVKQLGTTDENRSRLWNSGRCW
jgi:hypothetical protein